MFSIIFADNSFWRYEHVVFSILGSGCLYFFYGLSDKFKNLRSDDVVKYKDNKFILLVSAIHVGLQVAYHFAYNFAFIEYLSRLTFIFLVIYLNQNYVKNIQNFSENFKLQIDKALQVFGIFVLFVVFLSILNARAENSCGQNLYGLYIFIYLCLAGISFANAYQNLSQCRRDIRSVFEDIDKADLQYLTVASEILESTSNLTIFFYYFSLVVFSGTIVSIFVLYFKFSHSTSQLVCVDVFQY
jgi:hypothetical protein